jgi:putative endonuclease
MAFEKLASLKQNRTQFGQEVEVRVREWLGSQSGWRLLAQNFRTRAGEIDLIYEHLRSEEGRGPPAPRLELVFVEVRARAPDGLVSGIESVGPAKQQKLIRVARAYLSRYRGKARAARFDVVDWNGRRFQRVENAFDGC